MAEFQRQVGEQRTFIGKRYHFEPRPDITAYELARILKLVAEQAQGKNLADDFYFSQGIDPDLERHFQIQENKA